MFLLPLKIFEVEKYNTAKKTTKSIARTTVFGSIPAVIESIKEDCALITSTNKIRDKRLLKTKPLFIINYISEFL